MTARVATGARRRDPWPILRGIYVAGFYLFLFAPLIVVAVFAFNASPFPAPPWRNFTLDWFLAPPTGGAFGKPGVLRDAPLLASIGNSLYVAVPVTVLCMLVGTTNAFLLERVQFRGKALLSVMMLWPLVIPGVILGISILALASAAANGIEDAFDVEATLLRPGLPLIVLGQFSFIVTIATLVIAARLRKFDVTLEEAALNLGAGSWRVFRTVTLPFLAPSILGAGAVALLMSFENFNTTLMLVGSDPPLPVYMYGQMREGATPVINAVSLLLMGATGLVATAFALLSSRSLR
jgi:spermidine/putrescine transport system permease protein